MLFVPSSGTREPIRASRIPSASATTLWTGADKNTGIIESILVSNKAGAACTFKLWISNGTSDFYLIEDLSLAASGQYLLIDHHYPIKSGWSLKIQAGTASSLDVTGVMLISSPTGQR